MMALARLLNVKADDLMKEAGKFQYQVTNLYTLLDRTYDKIIAELMLFMELKSLGQANVFSDIFCDEDEEEDDDGVKLPDFDNMSPYEIKMWRLEQTADDRYDDAVAQRLIAEYEKGE